MSAIDAWRVSSTVTAPAVVQVLVLAARDVRACSARHCLHHRVGHTLLTGEVVEVVSDGMASPHGKHQRGKRRIAMPKPVAVDGDTQVKTSGKKHPSDTNSAGKWQLVSSRVTRGSKLSVADKLVEIGAIASWSYVGGTAGSPPVAVGPFSDSATLSASVTRLKDRGRDLLVDGDHASGRVDSDNKIVVTASQSKLRTE